MIDAVEDGERIAIGVAFQVDANPNRDEVTLYHDHRLRPPVRKALEDLVPSDIKPRWNPEDLRLTEVRETTVEFNRLIRELETLMDQHEAKLHASVT